MQLTSRAIDLASAALRHIRDAEWLAHPDNQRPSLDQAHHLAGYGPECARKATLETGIFDKSLGHQVGSAADDLLRIAVALEPLALRYEPEDWSRRYAGLAQWREVVRYDRTGSVQRDKLGPLLSEAREAVDSVVLALWADGRFPDGVEPW